VSLSLGTLCLVLGIILGAMILLMVVKRRARKNAPFVLTARIVACVLVQLLLLLTLTQATYTPGADAMTVDVGELLGHDSRDALIIFILVIADLAAIIVIALFKSSWVEPILR